MTDEGRGEFAPSLPPRSLDFALAGAVLMDAADGAGGGGCPASRSRRRHAV